MPPDDVNSNFFRVDSRVLLQSYVRICNSNSFTQHPRISFPSGKHYSISNTYIIIAAPLIYVVSYLVNALGLLVFLTASQIRDGSEHMLARCLLGTWCFWWCLYLLLLGVDVWRVLGGHQGFQHSLNVKITAPKMKKEISTQHTLTKRFSIGKIKHQILSKVWNYKNLFFCKIVWEKFAFTSWEILEKLARTCSKLGPKIRAEARTRSSSGF